MTCIALARVERVIKRAPVRPGELRSNQVAHSPSVAAPQSPPSPLYGLPQQAIGLTTSSPAPDAFALTAVQG